eukprot:CAMPEP_0183806364 /NCGR_PEP_ID=MMETSP0803_2-20130417/39191_1 /TAXON_ID=195967 /ORGANISM="Crustomastix stigmata, Strain CCMP3273" /LENGTH=60 /DNA_ID=CAMNT_0026051129 /DNA_START=21 /DNA_END=200 /DNA_ORIENTATION=-
MSEKFGPEHRHAYNYEGRTIYEWDQTLEEVNVYIDVPQGVRARDLDVTVASSSLTVGIRG